MPAIIYSDNSNETIVGRTNIQTITGAKTFQAADSATTPLTIIGVAGAAASLLNINTSDGVNRFKFETNGVFTAGYLSAGTRVAGTTLSITTPSASTKGVLIQSSASQTANLTEWVDSAGTLISKVTPEGFITAPIIYAGAEAINQTITSGAARLSARAPSQPVLVARAAASHAANIAEFQDSAGNILSRVGANGHLEVIGGGYLRMISGTGEGRLSTGSSGGSDGVTYQYGLLQQFNNTNPGTAARPLLSRIIHYGFSDTGVSKPAGDIRTYMTNAVDASFSSDIRLYTMHKNVQRENVRFGDAAHSAIIFGADAAARTLTVRAAASQTANVQEWQNSSGARLTSMTPGGIMQHETGWTAASLINSWTNYDSTGNVFPHAQFRKDANGYVYIKGLIQGGGSGTVAFVLPVGYRPRHSMHIPIIANGSTAYVRIGGIGETSPNAVQSPGAVSLTSLGGAVTTWSDLYSVPLFLAEG